MTFADRLLLVALIVVSALGVLHQVEPAQQLPLIHADWTRCALDRRGDPLGPEPQPKNMFPRRMDRA